MTFLLSLSVLKTDAVLWMGVQCDDPPACIAGEFSPEGDGKDGGGSYACRPCPPGTFGTQTGSSASVYSILTATALTISVLTRTVSLVHMYMSEVSILHVCDEHTHTMAIIMTTHAHTIHDTSRPFHNTSRPFKSTRVPMYDIYASDTCTFMH